MRIDARLTGRQALSADLFILRMFSMGRNNLILLSSPLYAFNPSKHYQQKIKINQIKLELGLCS